MNISGVCEVEPGLYSETIAFDDIAYQNSREQDQRSTCIVLQDLYNYFGPEREDPDVGLKHPPQAGRARGQGLL